MFLIESAAICTHTSHHTPCDIIYHWIAAHIPFNSTCSNGFDSCFMYFACTLIESIPTKSKATTNLQYGKIDNLFFWKLSNEFRVWTFLSLIVVEMMVMMIIWPPVQKQKQEGWWRKNVVSIHLKHEIWFLFSENAAIIPSNEFRMNHNGAIDDGRWQELSENVHLENGFYPLGLTLHASVLYQNSNQVPNRMDVDKQTHLSIHMCRTHIARSTKAGKSEERKFDTNNSNTLFPYHWSLSTVHSQ